MTVNGDKCVDYESVRSVSSVQMPDVVSAIITGLSVSASLGPVVPSDAVTSRAAQQSLLSTRRTPQRLAPGMTGKCFQRLLFC